MLYFCIFDNSSNGIFYGNDNIFRWIIYFPIILLGGICRLNSDEIRYRRYVILLLFICVSSWYLCIFYFKNSNWLIVSYIPFLFIPLLIYMVGKSPLISKLNKNPFVSAIIFAVSSLCLESYLIQFFIISGTLNHIFPYNVPIIFFKVLVSAYILRVLSNIISQFFASSPFVWKYVFYLKK